MEGPPRGANARAFRHNCEAYCAAFGRTAHYAFGQSALRTRELNVGWFVILQAMNGTGATRQFV